MVIPLELSDRDLLGKSVNTSLVSKIVSQAPDTHRCRCCVVLREWPKTESENCYGKNPLESKELSRTWAVIGGDDTKIDGWASFIPTMSIGSSGNIGVTPDAT
ncbi:unnamed protein product [Sphenostylis stenocarpa]|uniref:Uncharacterized protein n=1 Tax=Sphenostylis stenocarpa TaxID=92480 RepID=A0AA86T0S8_9FABA|nr:unnamed protein product [Sphenostylis stenocarpa]